MEHKLKQIMKERGITVEALANSLGITRSTLHNKLQKKYEFTAKEINGIVVFMRLEKKERDEIFFT